MNRHRVTIALLIGVELAGLAVLFAISSQAVTALGHSDPVGWRPMFVALKALSAWAGLMGLFLSGGMALRRNHNPQPAPVTISRSTLP